jgi:tetratricopeptide (TPR) repeat protein
MRGHSYILCIFAILLPGAGLSAGQSAPVAGPTSPAPAINQPLDAEQQGDLLCARQRYQAAIATYEKAPKMTPAIWNKMGIAYQMMFNAKDAARCYRESLKLDPRNGDVWNNLGTVYATQKLYGQADRMYRKALKLKPQSALALKNLGTDLLAEHKYEKGWAAYSQALALDPQIFSEHSRPTVENPGSVGDRGAMNYYMALGCARAGYDSCALEYLRKALNEGFATRKKVEAESGFASLKQNADFQQLMEEQNMKQP